MKTWFALLLTVGTFIVGCAAGDYARRPDYVERPPASGDTRIWHQNPETDAEQANRIWSMESRP
jgi:hypothetical protein